ncbi:hypothetical protein ZEAMMB73_Zm00001d021681 [Zea mays]|uniref:Uncharacterized protein n=1 Tax=Zea mays TaxID=4577 RepID=A0A1D6IDX2_MAIZE|nr:hypothetical protein ZEAMMB73_Zm00001d021681 [Zea mays]
MSPRGCARARFAFQPANKISWRICTKEWLATTRESVLREATRGQSVDELRERHSHAERVDNL